VRTSRGCANPFLTTGNLQTTTNRFFMSSPFGHSIPGYLFAAYESRTLKVHNAKKILFYMFLANAPDLDFLPGIMMGMPNLFHHGISHSLGAGVLFSLMVTFLIGRKENSYKRLFMVCFSLYCSHLFLDYVSMDGRTPIGIPLFWPLSNEYLIFPHPILPPIMHSGLDHATIGQFLANLFSIHNLLVVLLESAAMTPFLLILMVLKRYRERHCDLKLKAE
jgi:membrane-bound metal-dependent hydrolase YbcI (DUF457 family)